MFPNRTYPPFSFFRALFATPIFLAIVLFVGGCDSLPGNELTLCEQTAGVYDLKAIDGQSLPYFSVNIDSNNFSKVTEGSFQMSRDGGWESRLKNEKRLNGQSSTDYIDRSGSYTCSSGGSMRLTNDQTGAGATGQMVSKDTFVLGHDSGFESRFVRR